MLLGSPGREADAVESPEPLTLRLFRMPDPKDPSLFIQADLAVIRVFQERYPRIELLPFAGITIGGMAMDATPFLAITGGVSPDVIYVNFAPYTSYHVDDKVNKRFITATLGRVERRRTALLSNLCFLRPL